MRAVQSTGKAGRGNSPCLHQRVHGDARRPLFCACRGASRRFSRRPGVSKINPSWMMLGAIDVLPLGQPAHLTSVDVQTDAYIRESVTRHIWAIRHNDTEITVYSPICPHLGCHFDWNPSTKRFECPCHGASTPSTGKSWASPGAAPSRHAAHEDRERETLRRVGAVQERLGRQDPGVGGLDVLAAAELDRRAITPFIRLALDEEMAGGSSYAYVFGSSALIIFLLQLATGICSSSITCPPSSRGTTA